jgi:polyhydroxybutyrate depolymerase
VCSNKNPIAPPRCLWASALAALLIGWLAQARAETIDINGTTRTFIAQLPAKQPAPLVVVLHGNTQTGTDMAARTSWPSVAKREQFAVVFPDGLNRSWADLRPEDKRGGRLPPEGTDDVAFIVKLIGKYVTSGIVDPRRVYVTGLSNGGAMTNTLVCERADLFAAAASVIMNLTDETAEACHPSRPMPMLIMNGTADPLVPYEGGRGTSRFAMEGFWSTDKTVQFWRQIDGCEDKDASSVDLADRDPNDESTVTRITSTCPAGRDVLLYRINDGGHRMPASFPDTKFSRLVTYVFGPQNHDIDAAETIWDFFKRFP